MGEKRSVTDAAVRGRRVLVRVDFNVPQTPTGGIADDRRIVEALPTLEHLRAHGARSILVSHLGRPEGRRDPKLSLRPIAHRLSQLVGQPVLFADDAVGYSAIELASRMKDGDLLLLENVRFHAGEEANDPAFAAQLARLAELFVEDAFGTLHRAHASTVGVAKRLPSFAGLLVAREVRELSRLRDAPIAPYVAILGGAKVRDKLPLLSSFLGRTQLILIGGALSFPFLAAAGHSLGATETEPGLEPAVREFLQAAADRGTRVLLPEDAVIERPDRSSVEVVRLDAVPSDGRIRDIGPATQRTFASALAEARTVFWNGPLGLAEDARFSEGTRAVLGSLRGSTAYRVAAGGDSAAIAEALGVIESFNFISTGGGAALEFVQGADLPGLAVLPDAR